MIEVDKRVYEKYPGAKFGVLCVEGFEAKTPDAFNAVKAAEIQSIRNRHTDYDRKAFVQTDPVSHYVRYYKNFKKTYHVLLQLESIVLKDRTIPDVAPLIQALFLTEVKHLLLIAGHDLDRVVHPLTIKLATGNERYPITSGDEQELKQDDIYLRDAEGVIVSIIYGQDNRTLITPNTRNAVYVIKGVEGITDEKMMAGLESILGYLRVFDAAVKPALMTILKDA